MTNLESIQRHYFANKGLSCQGCGFSSSHVWIWELNYKESWVPKNWCFWTVVLKKTLRVPWTARRSSLSQRRSVLGVHWKDWYRSCNSNTLATWCEELTHLQRHWCWERLKSEGEGDDRGWDGWMASLIRWTWVWASSGIWWWIDREAWRSFCIVLLCIVATSS